MKKVILRLMLALGFYGCNTESQSNTELLNKFRTAIAPARTMSQCYQVVDLGKMTDFVWDSVYYFTGDVEERGISRAIGFTWHGPRVPEFCKRLLFVHRNHVVTFTDFPKYADKNDSSKWPMPIQMHACKEVTKEGRIVLSRNQAKFAVSRYCDRYGVVYLLINIKCIGYYRDILSNGCSDVKAKASTDSASYLLTK